MSLKFIRRMPCVATSFLIARIGKHIEFGLPGFLQAGVGLAKFFVGITRVAHQFRGAIGQVLQKSFDTFGIRTPVWAMPQK